MMTDKELLIGHIESLFDLNNKWLETHEILLELDNSELIMYLGQLSYTTGFAHGFEAVFSKIPHNLK